MKYVISMGFEMADYQSMRTAPAHIAHAGTNISPYKTQIKAIVSLAEFIRGISWGVGFICIVIIALWIGSKL